MAEKTVDFARTRTNEIERRGKYPLPPRDSGKAAFVIGCKDCQFFEAQPNPRRCKHMLSGVGQAGNLIPVGTVVLIDNRSGESLVRDGHARRATDREKAKAVPESSFKAKISFDKLMDPNDRIRVEVDIPQIGAKAGEHVPVAKLVALITAQALAQELKRPRDRKKVLLIANGSDSVTRVVKSAERAKRVRQFAPETRATR